MLSKTVLEEKQLYLNEVTNKYLGYFKNELATVLAEIDSLSEKSLAILEKINENAESSRKQADQTLNEAYLNTSREMAEDLKKVQNDVDAIISEALVGKAEHEKEVAEKEHSDLLRRQSGIWSKHLESLFTLEGLVCNPMFKAITTLSHDDIINHYMNNAIKVLALLSTRYFSGNMPVNQYEEYQFSGAEIQAEMLKFYSLYSMVREREVLEQFLLRRKIIRHPLKKSA